MTKEENAAPPSADTPIKNVIGCRRFGQVGYGDIVLTPLTIFTGGDSLAKSWVAKGIWMLHRHYSDNETKILDLANEVLGEDWPTTWSLGGPVTDTDFRHTEYHAENNSIKRSFGISYDILTSRVRTLASSKRQRRSPWDKMWSGNCWWIPSERAEIVTYADRFFSDDFDAPAVLKPFLHGLRSRERFGNGGIKWNTVVNIDVYSGVASMTHSGEEIMRGIPFIDGGTDDIPTFSFIPMYGPKARLRDQGTAVTSLAPIYMMLYYEIQAGDTVIIDEPERGLSPGMQQRFANIIMELVNEGLRIILITQSEWMLEQFATVIQANLLPKETLKKELVDDVIYRGWGERYGWDINVDNVGVWDFSVQEGRGAKIRELSCHLQGDSGGFGFVHQNAFTKLRRQEAAVEKLLRRHEAGIRKYEDKLVTLWREGKTFSPR